LRGRGISPKIKTAKIRTSIITGVDVDGKNVEARRHGQVYKLFTGETDVMKKLSDALTLVNGAVQTVSAISEDARISENGIGKDLEYRNWNIKDDGHIANVCEVKAWNIRGLGAAGPNNPLENDSYTQAAEKLNNIIMDGDTSFKERLDDKDLEVLDFSDAPRQLLIWESSCALNDAHHNNFCNSEEPDGHGSAAPRGTQGENANGRIYAIGGTTTTNGQDWSDEVLAVRTG
jgi:hypothetical protein